VATAPEAFLGPEHAELYGGEPGILVKLLDAGERLPVHLHPDRAFARERLGSSYGKSEAWVIAVADGADPSVHLGFREEVDERTLSDWVERQDVPAMLEALNRRAVSPGDAIFVPAGMPHAIGAGILIVEVQEPTDLSVLLEWEEFAIDGREHGHLGLGFDVALAAVDRSAWTEEELRELAAGRSNGPGRAGAEVLLPLEADRYFRIERICPMPSSPIPRGFSILVVLDGMGRLVTEGSDLPMRRGQTFLVPYAAGSGTIEGELELLRCMPPEVAVA
jgi:mannose-6-phosphate isomerase